MKILLDSHVFIWAIYKPDLIGKETKRLLAAADEYFVSVVSLWELGLKHRRGKLPFSIPELLEGAGQLGVEVLPLAPEHIAGFEHIVLPHKDPFDALLIAQSEQTGCSFITADREILKTQYRIRNAKV